MDTFKRLNSKVNDSNEHFKHKIRIPLNESAFYNVGYNINKNMSDTGPNWEILNVLQK